MIVHHAMQFHACVSADRHRSQQEDQRKRIDMLSHRFEHAEQIIVLVEKIQISQ